MSNKENITAEEIRYKYIPSMPSSISQLRIAEIKAMKEYASIKCQEQRQLCADKCEILEPNYNDILTAPEPEHYS